ncbi:MAG: ATP-binding protein [Candidatus Eremiobacter antarcticus]|nr:ATP-binding protein [Candidatus Eremiobacteraeota bacterium]
MTEQVWILDARHSSVVHDARAFVKRYLNHFDAAGLDIADHNVVAAAGEELELAVGEAVANVVRHAAKPPGTFELILRAEQQAVEAIITDYGAGFDLYERAMPAATAEHGRGLAIIQQLCDDVAYHCSQPNKLVLLKRIPARA